MVLSHHETSIRRAIAAVVRTAKPHAVVTHYPYPNLAAQPTCNGACHAPHNWDDMGFHPDHQRVGWHVLNTVYPSGGGAADNDLIFEDLSFAGVQSWKVSELYFFVEPGDTATHYLELDDELIARKQRAFGMHRSQ